MSGGPDDETSGDDAVGDHDGHATGRETPGDASAGDATTGDGAVADETAGTVGDEADGEGAADADAPLADLARRLAEGDAADAEAAAGGTDDGSGAFRRVAMESVDEEALWEDLEADASDVPAAVEAEVTDDATDADRPEHVVEKREYCQRCPHFSAPPAVACEHEGTTIVAVPDAAHFRVRGCPMAGEGIPPFRGGAVRSDDGEAAADATTEDAAAANTTATDATAEDPVAGDATSPEGWGDGRPPAEDGG